MWKFTEYLVESETFFLHMVLSSTQFSSDQIQNGGVNSDGRFPIFYNLASPCTSIY